MGYKGGGVRCRIVQYARPPIGVHHGSKEKVPVIHLHLLTNAANRIQL